LRRLVGAGVLSRARIALVFICQPKQVVSTTPQWGAPQESYIAFRPINFHSVVILKFFSMRRDKEGECVHVKVRCEKNNCGRPFDECEFDVTESGIAEERSQLDFAVKCGVVRQESKVMYSYHGTSFRRKGWLRVFDSDPSLRRTLRAYATGELKRGES